MLEAVTKTQAFQLKGSLFTLTVLQLVNGNVDLFSTQLGELVTQAPKFFHYAPIVIDLQGMQETDEIDFIGLNGALRDQFMIPVGIRGGTQTMQNQARAAGLAVLTVSKQDETSTSGSTLSTPEPTTTDSTTTVASTSDVEIASETITHSKTITKPVRSGQQVYAQGGDLIVLGPVSQGAELLADGNIHVYGPLRGRALAGISGDENARIFCSSLEAELISVAGNYIMNETATHQYQKQPHQIYLDNGKLRIQPLV